LADRLIRIVEDYFTALRDAHRTGAGTPERTYYPAVNNLLNAIGADLKPRVHCISDLGNTGAGFPDFALFAASQLQKGEPRKGQSPERGVIEMKPVADDAWLTAKSNQVSDYFETYRLVIVTNLRDFLIIGEDAGGRPDKRERFSLAKDAASFWELVSTPRKSAERIGRAFGEYLKRALTQSVSLREPKDLAWFLASYARDALERVEAKKDLQGLDTIKKALEEALGMKFEADKGEHFFRSTLVQTLFYGVFSSWVLWARQTPPPTGRFEWQKAIWHLNVPFVSALFQQLATPKQLKPLDLVELLDWTEATLNRVVKEEFLQKFNDADAVQFFYEPFLEAFDPDLRKELVHAERGRHLHGGARGQGTEGGPGRRRRSGLRQRLCARPLLRHRRLRGRRPAPHRPHACRQGVRRPQGPDGQEGGAAARARLRDHAGAVHCRAPAGGQRAAGAGRGPKGGPRARQRLPHQRAHRLGADRQEAAAIPRVGEGAR
jgi:hypothetical protein